MKRFLVLAALVFFFSSNATAFQEETVVEEEFFTQILSQGTATISGGDVSIYRMTCQLGRSCSLHCLDTSDEAKTLLTDIRRYALVIDEDSRIFVALRIGGEEIEYFLGSDATCWVSRGGSDDDSD